MLSMYASQCIQPHLCCSDVDYLFSVLQGVMQVFATQCWNKSMTPFMNKIRSWLKDVPTYCTFDIDAIDPAHCPGTGVYVYVYNNALT